VPELSETRLANLEDYALARLVRTQYKKL